MSSIESLYTTTDATTTTESSSSSMLDSDAFMQLLITEIQYQNPLDPLDSTEYVTQLAELAELEQLTLIAEGMDGIQETVDEMGVTSAISYLGTSVLADGSELTLSDGQASTVSVTLEDDAAEVTINILDSNGNVVATEILGESEAGTYSYTWDGTDVDGNAMDDGTYSVEVTALDENGGDVDTSTTVSGEVIAVSETSSGIVLTLEDGREVDLADVTDVYTI
ncbi:MAG: flagellar hook assembly protein FlgD [Desulfovibrionaceae bacterium]